MARGFGSGREPTSTENGATSQVKVLVPTEKVGKIIGRRGVMIRELQDRSGAKIDVSEDTEQDKKVVYVKGTPDQVKKAQSLISQTIKDEQESPDKSFGGEDEVTTEFSIPEHKCGLVIGSRGAKIREIQQETGVQANVGFRDSAIGGYVKVTLSGSKECCDNAQRVIESLISDSDVSYDEGSAEPGYSTTMKIPSELTRKLIGPQGSTIREIQNNSGAQVDVARRDTVVDGEIDVTLTGSQECCDAAKDAINKLLEDGVPAETATMWIHEAMCGLVIGSRGSKIREIQSNSGANVKIDKRDLAKDRKVKVTITGSSDQCSLAESIIEGIIADSNAAKEDSSAQYDPTEPSIQIWVPERKCGLIIGKGGSKIAEIQQSSNTRVDVNSRERNEDGLCLVTVSGSKDDCDAAKAIIDEIVSDTEREPRETREYNSSEKDERGSMDIWIDTSCLGRVIGKRGQKIKDIEGTYNIKVDVKKHVVEEHETKVVLIGSKDAVIGARDYIYSLVDEE